MQLVLRAVPLKTVKSSFRLTAISASSGVPPRHLIRRETMTTQEYDSRNRRTIEKIRTVFQANRELCQYASLLEVSIENATIVVRGHLPSGDLKAELVPAIRQAGVLCQVNNCVLVAA